MRRQRSSGRGQRELRTRVKSARGRKTGSTRWLDRQLNDPYVRLARREGLRGRAAYKLMEIDDRFGFLKPGLSVLDLGCAPGGWCQVAVRRVNADRSDPSARIGRVVGIDLNETDPIPGAELHRLDFSADSAWISLQSLLGRPVDVILSDMAAAATGHRKTDQLRTEALAERAAEFAFGNLLPGGVFVAKVLDAGAEPQLQQALKSAFTTVRNVKPPASRKQSSERYAVAIGLRK
ncbi:MAG: RlmE family RNA methyltransferase [Rhodobacteraceae bacterium]|nr:RlmE family RNA methyltransferase [Paracoccaceae bacterium]